MIEWAKKPTHATVPLRPDLERDKAAVGRGYAGVHQWHVERCGLHHQLPLRRHHCAQDHCLLRCKLNYIKLQVWRKSDSVTRWIFFFSLNILLSTFCVMCCDSLQGLSKFALPYKSINILFATLKLLTNFEYAYWNLPQNFLLCDWSMFSGADLSLAAGKRARINLS